jgi:hypothetical protein
MNEKLIITISEQFLDYFEQILIFRLSIDMHPLKNVFEN